VRSHAYDGCRPNSGDLNKGLSCFFVDDFAFTVTSFATSSVELLKPQRIEGKCERNNANSIASEASGRSRSGECFPECGGEKLINLVTEGIAQ